MKKIFFYFIVCFFIGSTSIILYNYHYQDKIIFKSEKLPKDFKYKFTGSYEETFVTVDKNKEINGVLFHAQDPKGIVLFLHGVGGNISHFASRSKFFLENGYDFFVFDYRNFGKSSSGHNEKQLLNDSNIIYKYLLNKNYKEKDIIIYGQSLGTSIATWLASKNNPKMLILESPFYNMIKAAKFTKPYLPEFVIKIILKYTLRTDKWIQNVNSPIVIIHGDKDTIVPIEQGKELFSKTIEAKKDSKMIIIKNANHNDIKNNYVYKEEMIKLLPKSMLITVRSN